MPRGRRQDSNLHLRVRSAELDTRRREEELNPTRSGAHRVRAGASHQAGFLSEVETFECSALELIRGGI